MSTSAAKNYEKDVRTIRSNIVAMNIRQLPSVCGAADRARGRQPLSFSIALALVVTTSVLPFQNLLAQTPAASVQASASPLSLHITILEGEGALNNVRERTAREPIIQIEDQNHKPVAGVAVLFTITQGGNGAGAGFSGIQSFSTVTNAEGRAIATGFKPNVIAGQYSVQVQASLGTASTSAVIHEMNALTANTGTEGTSSSTQPASAANPATSGASGTAGAATTTVAAGSRFISIINLVPKWVVVGVVAGSASAAAIAVSATANPTGTTISTGGSTVVAPTASSASGKR